MEMIQDIRIFLMNYVIRKIDVLRNKVNKNPYIMFGIGDDVVFFRKILAKNCLDNDDINDLLICFSDHIMDDRELLKFVSEHPSIYYEMEEAGINFDIRNIIIYYLLQSNDLNVVLDTFKLFSNKLVDVLDDRDIALYGDINTGNTLYDMYTCYKGILECEDKELQRKKAISFMSLVNIEDFKEEFKIFGISFDNVDEFIRKYEDSKIIDSTRIERLLNNMLLLEGRTLGDDDILKKALVAYKKYGIEHIYFDLDEFINYFNSSYKIDFKSFYFDRNAMLDISLLYSILTRKEDEKDSLTRFGEYLDRSRSLTNINRDWQNNVNSFKDTFNESALKRKIIIEEYSSLIERIKQPIDVTLNYYIYLNVPENLRDTFYEILELYYNKNHNYFGRNIFLDNDECKENTFKAILIQFKEAMFGDFKRRKFIHRDYLNLVRKMIGYRYVSIKDWNEYLYTFSREYYANEGLVYIKEMLGLIKIGQPLLPYQEENFEFGEFKYMCVSIKYMYPEMIDDVELVRLTLQREKEAAVLANRNLNDELILIKHSQIISDFIMSDCTSRIQFLKVTGISDLRFERAVNVVKEYNPSLYEEYINKILSCLSRRKDTNNKLLKTRII